MEDVMVLWRADSTVQMMVTVTAKLKECLRVPQKVLQMVTDYNKWLPNGGDGYMRLVEIDEDAGEIRVQTYTPGIPTYDPPTPAGYRTNADGQFTVAMAWTKYSASLSSSHAPERYWPVISPRIMPNSVTCTLIPVSR